MVPSRRGIHGGRKCRIYFYFPSIFACFVCFVVVKRARNRLAPVQDVPSTYRKSRFVVFSCPKGSDHLKTTTNEEKAISSWILWTEPQPDLVLLVGLNSNEGVKNFAESLEHERKRRLLRVEVSFVQIGPEGLVYTVDDSGPSLRAVFAAASSAIYPPYEDDIFMYVNSDVVLPKNVFFDARRILNIAEQYRPGEVVLSGSRHDCSSQNNDEYVNGETKLPAPDAPINYFKSCVLHAPTGKDYWIFRRNFWYRHGGIPGFMLGRFIWDDYLALVANMFGMFVDVSPIVQVFHLGHDYTHTKASGRDELVIGSGRKLNLRLMEEAWSKIGPYRQISDFNLNSAYWRACPMDSIGLKVLVESAQSWNADEAWVTRTRLVDNQDKCALGALFGCVNLCSKEASNKLLEEAMGVGNEP